MRMDGTQFEQFLEALKSAFPTIPSLKILVRTRLNENLEEITSCSNVIESAYSLIEWAERYGRLEELVNQAYLANSGNSKLRRFAEQFGSSEANPENTAENKVEANTHQDTTMGQVLQE